MKEAYEVLFYFILFGPRAQAFAGVSLGVCNGCSAILIHFFAGFAIEDEERRDAADSEFLAKTLNNGVAVRNRCPRHLAIIELESLRVLVAGHEDNL